VSDPTGVPAVPDRLRELVEAFIQAAETYRIHSELTFDAPIEITVAMLKARHQLEAALAQPSDVSAPKKCNCAGTID
jgi:hypothetical protein